MNGTRSAKLEIRPVAKSVTLMILHFEIVAKSIVKNVTTMILIIENQ